MKKWMSTHAVRFPSVVNVIPLHDIIDHDPGLGCRCGPRKEVQHNGIHSPGVLIIHHRIG